MLGLQRRCEATTVKGTPRPILSGAACRLLVMAYYLAVVAGLLVLYGRGEVSTAGFIYQAF